MKFPRILIAIALLFPSIATAQSTSASITGLVDDPAKALIPGVAVTAINTQTGEKSSTATNKEGQYVLPGLNPGTYRIEVDKQGFKGIIEAGLVLHVQDVVQINFHMALGSASESITVSADEVNMNTTDGSVSTVIDRNFAENLPLNGRSFQTLIDLTPGVVLTGNNSSDNGQFSVNGQRASSNYWTVDGVSANLGVGVSGAGGAVPGNGFSGAVGSYSAMGGTNSLVSVDALQEFRIQTSTYAPEFGRTPGGQVSILTRSGTNQLHGSAFDYLRNDVFDANNWFNGYTNNPPLPKAEERQNDFGGTLGGPIFKSRIFFFFSYEGLRLRLPETTLTTVPDASFTPGGTTDSRASALPALQPYLNAFPLPSMNSPEIFASCTQATDPSCPPSGQEATGSAALNASYSNPNTLNAYSLRIDHKLTNGLTLFGRYNYSPSQTSQRGVNDGPLNNLFATRITTQTATIGATWALSANLVNDFRLNYSKNVATGSMSQDNFLGAIPLTALPFPSPFTPSNAVLFVVVNSLTQGGPQVGSYGRDVQRQINLVDSVSIHKGPHALKFGLDFRRLTPISEQAEYSQFEDFADVPSLEEGSFFFGDIGSTVPVYPLFRNLGVFAQDTWTPFGRLTLTYGLRWDLDVAPSTISGPSFPAVTNFNDLANLALAPQGTPPFRTTYGNVAPRLGVAYQISQASGWQTVLRGGLGVFFDMATSEAGNTILGSYPFEAVSYNFTGGSFPLNSSAAVPPPITPANLSSGTLGAFNPHLQLPYTLEWNFSLEQGLGRQQSVSASYIGSAGRRLIQSAYYASLPNPNIASANLIGNTATSDYDALQTQFRRQLSHGLQLLASYTWSHSIDTASAGSYANAANRLVPGDPNANRGPSDFDNRNAFSAALTYEIPAPKLNAFSDAVLRGWSSENQVFVNSARPLDIQDVYFNGFSSGVGAEIRPDVVPDQPFYLYGSEFPGRRAINPAAFMNPPVDPSTGYPLRQGDLARNALRGFGLTQWDFAIHREFPIHESLKLQFRSEMFNVLNHPNFGPPSPYFGFPNFGLSTQMFGESINNGQTGNGGFSPLYQLGGPRSMQFALKITF